MAVHKQYFLKVLRDTAVDMDLTNLKCEALKKFNLCSYSWKEEMAWQHGVSGWQCL